MWMFGFVFELVEELSAGESDLNPARARTHARHPVPRTELRSHENVSDTN